MASWWNGRLKPGQSQILRTEMQMLRLHHSPQTTVKVNAWVTSRAPPTRLDAFYQLFSRESELGRGADRAALGPLSCPRRFRSG